MPQSLLCFFSGQCMSTDIKTTFVYWFMLLRISAAYASKQMPFFIGIGLLRHRAQHTASHRAQPNAKTLKSRAFCAYFQAFWICAKCTKSSINQMVKRPKKLINLLTKCVNMLKGRFHQGGKSLGVVCVRVLRHFSVFPHIHALILPGKLQKITKCFQCGYKTETKLKHRTHYAIFQNRHICASC